MFFFELGIHPSQFRILYTHGWDGMDPTSYLPMGNLMYNGHGDGGGEAITLPLLTILERWGSMFK